MACSNRYQLASSTDVEIGLRTHLFIEGIGGRRWGMLLHNVSLAVLEQCRKFDAAVIRDLDMRSGASNAHGCDGSVDFHVTGFGNFAGNKGERTFCEAEQSRVGIAVRIVNELIHYHTGVAGQTKSSAVCESNTEASRCHAHRG